MRRGVSGWAGARRRAGYADPRLRPSPTARAAGPGPATNRRTTGADSGPSARPSRPPRATAARLFYDDRDHEVCMRYAMDDGSQHEDPCRGWMHNRTPQTADERRKDGRAKMVRDLLAEMTQMVSYHEKKKLLMWPQVHSAEGEGPEPQVGSRAPAPGEARGCRPLPVGRPGRLGRASRARRRGGRRGVRRTARRL